METLKKRTRVRVIADYLDEILGRHGMDGRTGTVLSDDGEGLMAVTVDIDDSESGPYVFNRAELEVIPLKPTAPQTIVILNHLKEVGNISGIEASSLYKCRSLPRRIADLKELGWPITSLHKMDRTGQRYVRYELEAPHA